MGSLYLFENKTDTKGQKGQSTEESGVRLVTGQEKIYPTLHCMGPSGAFGIKKSAEVIDEKGVGIAPMRKRVRIRLKVKEIDRERTPRMPSV